MANPGVTYEQWQEAEIAFDACHQNKAAAARSIGQHPETFRNRAIRKGSQIVVSPWHLHRHERLWVDADVFDPTRWQTKETKKCARDAYMPFSTGARACPGAGFAMIEGVVLIYTILKAFKIELADDEPPIPVAHLTVRSKDGIFLRFIPR